MLRYKLLLLDLDGTLMDFEQMELRSLKACFRRFGLEESKEHIKTYLKANEELWHALEKGKVQPQFLRVERFRLFLERIDGNESLAEEMSEDFLDRISQGRDLMEGAVSFLESVREARHIAIVTNGFAEVQRSRLSGSPIADYIDRLYISEDYGAPKPSPLMLEKAMQDFRICNKKEVLFIGDSVSSDVMAAKNAGIDCVLIADYTHPDAKYRANNIVECIAIANQSI